MPRLNEAKLRDEICRLGRSLFQRGLTFGAPATSACGSTDGWLMTPTNVSLGPLDPARLAKLDAAGKLVSGDPPTKETFLHFAMYEQRPQARRGGASALHPFRRRLGARPTSMPPTCCRRSPPIT